ncbi:putative membrane protein [Devosia subaequoris]|uniref:Putative membrane protein n=1 Tax=Devosia subaequoris TaxID=395930 RepID=A0A7W6NBC7_9HYPH|nr:TIGR01620 family protein [Devosia subaequoris]MBB4051521.1 putative membrane protein [Devosia subaequoris]MCP1209114.1 YcjF family protein [Devosia subaequoris]
MKRPVAHTVTKNETSAERTRAPRAFTPDRAEIVEVAFTPEAQPDLIAPAPRRMGWRGRLAWTTGGILISAGLGLAADRLIRDLFARHEWLGWAGLGILGAFLVAVIALIIREMAALRRLSVLDAVRAEAARAHADNDRKRAGSVLDHLNGVYSARPDLARARKSLNDQTGDLFDGAEVIALAERSLMTPLDARSRALVAASARRVALVTAVSPRALIDVAFVIYESIRLAGAIAALYGARPGLFGFWRLAGAVLTHLAVTGGLVLTDGVVEQLVGQGLAAKLSARLGEGVVNGLMTVRVGIAAMRVVRPLPFETLSQPTVRDFIPELVKVTTDAGKPAA